MRDTASQDTIFPKGEAITNAYFSGAAWLQMLVTDDATFRVTIGNVTFGPGVRNNWHTHPGGQVLLCISGTGYYQEQGRPIQLLRTGDVVQIYPGVVHWHGASPDSVFTHLAVTVSTPTGGVDWLQPVTAEEYGGYKAP